jgi:hypothetical protein
MAVHPYRCGGALPALPPPSGTLAAFAPHACPQSSTGRGARPPQGITRGKTAGPTPLSLSGWSRNPPAADRLPPPHSPPGFVDAGSTLFEASTSDPKMQTRFQAHHQRGWRLRCRRAAMTVRLGRHQFENVNERHGFGPVGVGCRSVRVSLEFRGLSWQRRVCGWVSRGRPGAGGGLGGQKRSRERGDA